MSNKKFGTGFNGKGYYIALILCAVAIGISGYLYYNNANEPEPQLNQPDVTVNDTLPQEDIPVVATQPQGEGTVPSGPATQPTTPVTTKPIKTGAPLEGQTVAEYAMECLGYNATTRDWRTHNGVDIAAEAGTKVCAAADGTVYTVYEDDTMGTTVVIRHDGGYVTVYASLDPQVLVKSGDSVSLGQPIGCVGQSALLESAIGDHVHFAVSCNDVVMDPAEFLSLG